jgi:hypothetical protein
VKSHGLPAGEKDRACSKDPGGYPGRIPGNINPKAIFTIGLSHLPDHQVPGRKQGQHFSPLPGKNEDYTADLNLKRENFGVSILIPQLWPAIGKRSRSTVSRK